MFAWIVPRGIVEEKKYKALDRVFPLVAKFICRSTEKDRSRPVTRGIMQYSEIVGDLM